MENVPPDDAKKRKSQAPRRLSPVNIDRIQHYFLVVLNREATKLMDESYLGKLSADSSKDLVNYLKLLREIRKSEEEDLEQLSDFELEKLNQKTKKENEK